MRIQETNQVLKDARIASHGTTMTCMNAIAAA